MGERGGEGNPTQPEVFAFTLRGVDTARMGLLLGYASVSNEQVASAFDKLAAIIKTHWT